MDTYYINNNCLFFTDICGGYLSFGVSIFCIGVVTAIIGDVASHFGCTLGIKDSVTAIVFVALGTSIPGMILIIGKSQLIILLYTYHQHLKKKYVTLVTSPLVTVKKFNPLKCRQ